MSRGLGDVYKRQKVYRATFVFGQTTDTLDITGNITGECDVFPTKEQIDVAVSAIHGEIDQIPPQYSAKSVDGVRAYDFARKGIEVDLKPKRITIYYIKTVDCDLDGTPYKLDKNEYAFEIACSSGTYIRSIARDLGCALGTVAYMSSIHRIKSGDFEIQDAVTLTDFEKEPFRYLKSVDFALKSYGRITLDEQQKSKALNGVAIKTDELPDGDYVVDDGVETLAIGHVSDGILRFKTRL